MKRTFSLIILLLSISTFSFAEAFFLDKADFEDTPVEHSALIAGISTNFNHFSTYYLYYSPYSFGMYGGMTFQNKQRGVNPLGSVGYNDKTHPQSYDLGNLNPLNTLYSYKYDWKFDYNPDNIDYLSVGLYGGTTYKIAPYTWLLAGVGIDFPITTYYEGDLYYSYESSEYVFYDHCYLKDDAFSLFIGPQLGINAIVGSLDLGFIFTYPIHGKWSLDIIAGIVF